MSEPSKQRTGETDETTRQIEPVSPPPARVEPTGAPPTRIERRRTIIQRVPSAMGRHRGLLIGLWAGAAVLLVLLLLLTGGPGQGANTTQANTSPGGAQPGGAIGGGAPGIFVAPTASPEGASPPSITSATRPAAQPTS